MAVLVAAGFGVYSMLHHSVPPPFQNFTIAQGPNSGKAGAAAMLRTANTCWCMRDKGHKASGCAMLRPAAIRK